MKRDSACLESEIDQQGTVKVEIGFMLFSCQ